MAKTSFTHSCGHEGRVTGRNRRDADYQAGKYALRPCWECEKAESTRMAAEAAVAAGLPQLTGSEKQVAYGESMRARNIKGFDEAVAALRARIDRIQEWQRAAMADALIVIEDEVRGQTAAKFWIEAPVDWRGWIIDQIKARRLVPTEQV